MLSRSRCFQRRACPAWSHDGSTWPDGYAGNGSRYSNGAGCGAGYAAGQSKARSRIHHAHAASRRDGFRTHDGSCAWIRSGDAGGFAGQVSPSQRRARNFDPGETNVGRTTVYAGLGSLPRTAWLVSDPAAPEARRIASGPAKYLPCWEITAREEEFVDGVQGRSERPPVWAKSWDGRRQACGHGRMHPAELRPAALEPPVS